MSKPGKSPRVTAPADSAAGPAAIARVAADALRKPGLRRGLTALRALNQPDGFDCPGCAWPEPPDRRKAVEFCENGAKAVADEATRRRADSRLFARYSVAELAERSDRWLNDQGRLTEPLVLRPGADHYQPIDWGEACALVASELRGLDEPAQAVFYTSGRTSNEAAFLWQLFARRLGTNNLPDSSNLCHESSGRAMLDAIGVSKSTVGLGDFALADCIFVVGQNPGSNHPRMLATLQAAKRRGARIVSINPLQETGLRRFRNPQEVSGLIGAGTVLADLHLPVRINGDVALFKGLCKAMLEQETARPGTVLDHEFILGYSSGFDAFRADIEATAWTDIVGGSGVGEELIREAAELAMQSRATICCWAMGLTQHHNAMANIHGILNFLMMRGNLGRPGAGACPVRGHSNVQGDRTMGITERPGAAWLDRLRREFGFDPPEAHGLDAVDAIRAMHAGRVRVFLALGGNFLSASPDTAYTSEALKRCRLTVQVSTKLNRAHLVTGQTGLILPALVRSEADRQSSGLQFVTCENSMSVVQPSAGRLKPASTALHSEVRIVAELAAATLGEDPNFDWQGWADDYALIRERIEAAVPGFEEFAGRLARDGQLVLPNPVRDERRFLTEDGRARFSVHGLPDSRPGPGRYLMMTIRSHDQFNTTVYSDEDRYRGISGSRQVVLMSTADMASAGLAAGDRVAITSHYADQLRRLSGFAVVPYDIPPGCVATYYPEANPLVPVDQVAEVSNTPAYKSVIVSIESLR